MRTTTPNPRFTDNASERRPAPGPQAAAVTLLAIAATCIPLTPARAQGAAGAQTRPCAQIEADEERLACFDRETRAAEALGATPPTGQRPESTRTTRDAEAPEPAAAPNAARPPTERGAEKDEIIPIVVVQVDAIAGYGAALVTDQGEVYVQLDTQREYYPPVPFDAELRRGALNSYFLSRGKNGGAVRVRRWER